MASSHAGGGAGILPAPFTGVPLLLLCILLTLLLTVVRFPFGRLEPALRSVIAQATGATFTADSLGIRPTLGLVGLKAWGVELAWSAGASLEAEQLTVRPAWSTSWLSGSPAIHVSATNGAAAPPQIPVSVPFERLAAEVAFDDQTVGVHSAALEGPMIAATAAGSLSRDALNVDGQISARDPGIAALLEPAGIRVDAEGNAPFELRGTPSRPILR